MIAKDENLLIKVVKRAVGLPTGNSNCACSASAPKATTCCSTEAAESPSTDCGCHGTAHEDEEPRAKTA